MRTLVGYMPDPRGEDALALATLVIRATSSELVVVNVHPPAWSVPGPGAVDAEWVAYLEETANAGLAEARRRLSGRRLPAIAYIKYANRGSGRGLTEVAADASAELIVIGSSPGGRAGRIAIGSTADQLLHGSSVPVMLAPRGFAADPPRRFERLTFAFRPGADSDVVVPRAADFAASLGVPLRLITLIIRPPGPVRPFVRGQIERAESDLTGVRKLVEPYVKVDTEVACSSTVAGALRTVGWLPGEILASASSVGGPIRTVFLGDTSGKLVRAAPCPALVLPGAG